jgi:long-chain fatty acid transport protein
MMHKEKFFRKRREEKMKRGFFGLAVGLCICSSMVFGQIVTNTNQSAQYMRMLARNASTDIDAVYYNPAGLVRMEDGWHFSLSNQTIFQEKTVTNAFPLLNQAKYVGDVTVPIFPNFYAAYKTGDLVFSLGFGPNSGGGSADFKNGLPSFEIPISQLPMMMSGLGLPTTAYDAGIAFSGTSVFYGLQLNVSYALSDIISAAGGIRYISANNTYEGGIQGIMFNPYHPYANPNADMVPAYQFFNSIGLSNYAAMVADKQVEVKQTGSGVTPLLGINFNFSPNFNIGIRYEFQTKLELENQTTVDDTGMFPDGNVFRNDIPAIFSIGAEYVLTRELRAFVSYNLFFEKQADLNGAEELIDSNTYDLAFALEYMLSDTVAVSGGVMLTRPGVSDEYQSDFSHEISANTLGFGSRISITPRVDLDLGVLYVMYDETGRNFTFPGIGDVEESYTRSTWGFSFGIGYH